MLVRDHENIPWIIFLLIVIVIYVFGIFRDTNYIGYDRYDVLFRYMHDV